MNITRLFLDAALRHSRRAAIIDKKRSVSYGELEQGVRQTAAYFKNKGIGKGDRVLVFVPMSIDLYRVVLALFYIGATAVFLDEWVNKKRLALCCKLADCKGFVGILKARLFALSSGELRKIPVKLKPGKMGEEELPLTDVEPDTTALITFTTGSTGTPKAANRTHQFLQAQFDALQDEIDPRPNETDMTIFPIVLFFNLGNGCTSVIPKFKLSKPEAIRATGIIDQIKQHNVTRITASPFFTRKLADHLVEDQSQLVSIQKIITGGAPVFPREAKLYRKAFPKPEIKVVYGSTEVEPISTIDADELITRENELSRGLPVGKPFHKTSVKIMAISGDPVEVKNAHELDGLCLAEGNTGEIIVSGNHVLKQYFNNESAFRQNKIVAGNTTWHRTGDSGFIKDGELFLTGRCNQLIPTQNGYLSPFVVENKLQSIEGISIGTCLKINGKVVVVVETQLAKDRVEPGLEQLRYDELKVIPKIPRDPRHHSKIDYEKLKRLLG